MGVANLDERLIALFIFHFAFALDLGKNVADVVHLQVGTEFCQENIHASANGLVFVAPDFLKNDFTWDEFVFMVEEEFEQLGFLAGEGAGTMIYEVELHKIRVHN